ncbi:hypothetical protein OJF2_14730 [Aquisphaera giovannonii]|uniref:Uncharacterized protein n=1 Tax=Aquisphaera giovannonii TaxID=406548 RepID=A0A5B9VYH5_9BACT|nr:hypothetical protein [Aquisphaera giovannonii]QEH32981.1 hypothetical protein OJF2_14730 [Aquisphaera giovannonii]
MGRHRVLPSIAIGAALLSCAGCGTPLLVQVATEIHADGRCDRTIWQPEKELLPGEAATVGWRARWARLEPVEVPPALRDVAPHPDHKYFLASGTFPGADAIPEHYARAAPEVPGVGASVLTRAYARRDLGFVVEHDWRETVTDVVRRDDFLRARDELLDRGLPMLAEAIDEVYGRDFDATRLRAYVGREGRAFLEKAAAAYFDVGSRHLGWEEARVEYARAALEFGLDLFDSAGTLLDAEEAGSRFRDYLRHRLALGIRHRDGSRLTAKELDGILSPGGSSPYASRAEAYVKAHEGALKRLAGPLMRMTGHYRSWLPSSSFGAQPIRFAFGIRLPGEVIETNGKADGKGGTCWTFSGEDIYPSGYTMAARSLAIDEDAQRLALGRVAIADRRQAASLAALLGDSEPLRRLVIRVREARDPGPLKSYVADTAAERARLQALRRLLGIAE